MIKRPRVKNEKHLKFIRGLPCICCGNNIETQACHVRMDDARADKRSVGLQEKPDDVWVLPMCGVHHAAQHDIGERNFWDFGVLDPIFVCLALWRVSGDQEAGERIIAATK
jgi:hypothetical protein